MSYFHWCIISDNVKAFGDTFNNLTLRRKESDTTYKEIKIPIGYSNGSLYIDRYTKRGDNPNDIKDLINITVPRMSFKIIDMHYDSERKLNRLHKIVLHHDIDMINDVENYTIQQLSDDQIETYTKDSAMSVYTPVPYIITFELYILTNREDDSNQILEQIIPRFTPDLNIPISYVFGPALKQSSAMYKGRASLLFDSPLTLMDVHKEDTHDGDYTKHTRTILHTLTFELRCKFFRDFDKEKLIKILSVNFNLGVDGEDVEVTKLFAQPLDRDIIVNLDKYYDKFYDDMFQDPIEDSNSNIGDEHGLV